MRNYRMGLSAVILTMVQAANVFGMAQMPPPGTLGTLEQPLATLEQPLITRGKTLPFCDNTTIFAPAYGYGPTYVHSCANTGNICEWRQHANRTLISRLEEPIYPARALDCDPFPVSFGAGMGPPISYLAKEVATKPENIQNGFFNVNRIVCETFGPADNLNNWVNLSTASPARDGYTTLARISTIADAPVENNAQVKGMVLYRLAREILYAEDAQALQANGISSNDWRQRSPEFGDLELVIQVMNENEKWIDKERTPIQQAGDQALLLYSEITGVVKGQSDVRLELRSANHGNLNSCFYYVSVHQVALHTEVCVPDERNNNNCLQ